MGGAVSAEAIVHTQRGWNTEHRRDRGNPAVALGTLTTGLAFGAGTGTLNFNHTSTSHIFAPAIGGNGTVNVLAGTTILTAAK